MTGAWPAGVTHDLVVTSPAPAWSLQYLELSSHDGASSGANQLFVIPKASTPFSPPSSVEVMVFWFATLGLFLLPVAARLPRAVRIFYGLAVAAIGTLLVLMVLAPWLSRFSIVVSWATLGRFALVLALPALWRVGAGVVTHGAARQAIRVGGARPARPRGGPRSFLPFVFVMRERLRGTYLGNYSGFVQIGEVFVDQSPYIAHEPDVRRTLVVEEGGYGSQFMLRGLGPADAGVSCRPGAL